MVNGQGHFRYWFGRQCLLAFEDHLPGHTVRKPRSNVSEGTLLIRILI